MFTPPIQCTTLWLSTELVGKLSELFCAVLCTTIVRNDSTHVWTVLKAECWFKFRFFRFRYVFVFFLSFCSHVVCFVVLDLIYSVLSQEIGWEELLWNELFCVEYDVKTLTQSISNWCLQDDYVIHAYRSGVYNKLNCRVCCLWFLNKIHMNLLSVEHHSWN